MQPNGLPTYSELELEIERLHRVISGGIDIASAHGMQILDLQRRIIEQNATIARQAAQLEQYAKMLDDERATVSVLRESIVQLRTALDAVPLQEIMQYMHGTMYDPRANVDDYMPDDYDADRTAIDAWLRKELSADE